jgi:adenylate cyclase
VHQAQEAHLSGSELATGLRRRGFWDGALANTGGALLGFAFLAFLAPVSPGVDDVTSVLVLNAVVFATYMPLTLVLGGKWARRISEPIRRWLETGCQPDGAVRELILRYPLEVIRISATFWVGAAVLFGAINTTVSPVTGVVVVTTILMGGATTCALLYLLTERRIREITALALAGQVPAEPRALGIRGRLVIAWALGTGIPIVGVVGFSVVGLVSDSFSKEAVARPGVFLGALALAVGLLATFLAARSVADPITEVRGALARVEQGDFDVEVPVDDGSEIGFLEAGFNRMAAGLRDRERLQDLFGRHVGKEVAEAALQAGVELGGEVREVGVLFVDLVGSTSLAVRHPPEEVVALFNRFFKEVVHAAEANGGHVNKFEGDAALCVFGAPTPREDPAGDSLAAARTLRERLDERLSELDAGIGVSAGPAVAGNIGAEERFEYTVIGDPVNEAARLCELAKQRPERLLASEAAIDRARPEEASRWTLGEAIVLRGRHEPTRLATVASVTARTG